MTMPPPEQPPRPPAPPYAPQQQPWGYPQQAYPQQGWGPPPAQPQRGRGSKILMVCGVTVVVLGALGRYVNSTVNHSHSDGGSHAAAGASGHSDNSTSGAPASPAAQRYKLTVPRTLLGGRYTLDNDMTHTMEDGLSSEHEGPNEHNMHGAGGQYTDASGASGTLQAAGMYGTIDDPKTAMRSMFRGMNENPGVEVTTPAKDFTPPGVQEAVSCEEFAYTRPGQTQAVSIPVCDWSDHSTVVTVTIPDAPSPVGLEALAKTTAQVRDAMRVPAS
ncbi:hypothetical protein [Streptomyces morookaense]|uniref:Uncharacterized protein n=1 Tax=Streptomyces morookaense TaxID=1970 RepID=A0A7Y7B6V7_STRMO|nr:hypothetical protein [Streptomyces morookaense]NVK80074.1 hypothetical protein [Streptomyces morookaense]GHF46158.1 hypothetical protein GCM10010359_55780 [Streptomyces morookaense]